MGKFADREPSIPAAGPEHGGNLLSASRQFGIEPDQWLDLSTGINPDGYPVPTIPSECFYRLPERNDERLLAAARRFYGAQHLLAAAGSQPFIELLPSMKSPCRVAIPDVGYREHAWHWQRFGHKIVWYSGFAPEELERKIHTGDVDCAVIINPNNPSAGRVSLSRLHEWQQHFAKRNGWLIIDEAFADSSAGPDADPDAEGASFAPFSHKPGVCVLRSVGKFFGLAGIRVGFALAGKDLLAELNTDRGLWSISGVSSYIATQALSDEKWQRQARQQLTANSEWMRTTLRSCFSTQPLYDTSLFISVLLPLDEAETTYQALASGGVLTRLWCLPNQKQALLRFGLISSERDDHRARLTKLLGQVQ